MRVASHLSIEEIIGADWRSANKEVAMLLARARSPRERDVAGNLVTFAKRSIGSPTFTTLAKGKLERTRLSGSTSSVNEDIPELPRNADAFTSAVPVQLRAISSRKTDFAASTVAVCHGCHDGPSAIIGRSLDALRGHRWPHDNYELNRRERCDLEIFTTIETAGQIRRRESSAWKYVRRGGCVSQKSRRAS